MNITSLVRGLNLDTIVSNGVFFLNTGAAIYALGRTSALFLTIRAQRLGPDSSELNGVARG